MDDSGEASDKRRLHSRRPEHVGSREMRDVVGDLQAEDISEKAEHRYRKLTLKQRLALQERTLLCSAGMHHSASWA